VEIQSRLVVSTAVSDAPNDKEQLVPTLGCVSPVVQSIGAVLIDDCGMSCPTGAESSSC
jgi:hypothetical protein